MNQQTPERQIVAVSGDLEIKRIPAHPSNYSHAVRRPSIIVRGLLQGEKGITTHAYVSRAWKQSTHWDPGPGFPFHEFVAAVAKAMVGK